MPHYRFLFLFSFLISSQFICFQNSSLAAGQDFALQSQLTQDEFNEQDEIFVLEKSIEEFHSKMVADGYSTQDFYQRIVTPMSEGKELDKTYLLDWEQRNSEFHHQRYLLIAEKQAFFITSTHKKLNHFIEQLPDPVRFKNRKQISKVESRYKQWEDHCLLVGEGLDPREQRLRLYGFRDFFKEARTLLVDLGVASKPKKHKPSLGRKIKGGLQAFSSLSYLSLQLLFRDIGAILDYPFHYALPEKMRIKIAKATLKNWTPFTSRGGVTSMFHGTEDLEGYHVSVEGKEYLKTIPLNGERGRKVVNLFLPPHRDPLVDGMVMSRLGLPHFLMFGNPSAFAPNVVFGQMIATIPEFISVGKWKGFPSRKPTDKLIHALERKRSPNVFSYPQGFVTSTGEILPINAQFVRTLLNTLITQGFEVNIIPVTYEVGLPLLSRSGQVDELKATARIHPPIPHQAIKSIVTMQMEAMEKEGENFQSRYIDHLLATLWYENINLHKELSLSELLDRAGSSLPIN